MTNPPSPGGGFRRTLVTTARLAVACCCIDALSARAAEPAGGGLRASVMRAELFREWDLDNNGKISKSEADVARARMRRERLEMQVGGGLDPLTGLPRDPDGQTPSDEEPMEEDEGPVYRLPPELPPVKPALPRATPGGMTPPSLTLPSTPAGRSADPTAALRSRPGMPGRPAAGPAAAGPRPVSSRASWLPPRTSGPAAVGGVRAGAPAAVPGYGSSPWADLNAGRQRFTPGGPTTGGSRASTSGTGGLLPQPLPDGRTGAILLPPVNGVTSPPAVIRPTPPQPPLMPRPRIMADEIGGYRP